MALGAFSPVQLLLIVNKVKQASLQISHNYYLGDHRCYIKISNIILTVLATKKLLQKINACRFVTDLYLLRFYLIIGKCSVWVLQ